MRVVSFDEGLQNELSLFIDNESPVMLDKCQMKRGRNLELLNNYSKVKPSSKKLDFSGCVTGGYLVTFLKWGYLPVPVCVCLPMTFYCFRPIVINDDFNLLQCDINSLIRWSVRYYWRSNYDNPPKIGSSLHLPVLHSRWILPPFGISYLGVILDVTWDPHVNALFLKSKRLLVLLTEISIIMLTWNTFAII